ncbi:hypothetical protein D3C74_373000 [compost metagenome]
MHRVKMDSLVMWLIVKTIPFLWLILLIKIMVRMEKKVDIIPQNGFPMHLIRRSAPMLKYGRMEARKISPIPDRPEQKR